MLMRIRQRHRRRRRRRLRDSQRNNQISVPKLCTLPPASTQLKGVAMKGSKLQLQLIKVVLLITLCSSLVSGGVEAVRVRRRPGKHLVIHVPMKIRTHHHTHTVFTKMHPSKPKQTIYKIMGYSTHHHSSAGSGEGGGGSLRGGRGCDHDHGYRHSHRKEGGYVESDYDDYTNTNSDSSLAHGDMILNNFSRHDEDYPDVEEEEELIEEDDRVHDEWKRL